MMIRPLTALDLPLVRVWMREVPEAPVWSTDDLARLIAPAAADELLVRRGWMAVREDIPAGFVVATALCVPETAAECEIEFVMTARSHRRMGVARSLVGTVIGWARELAAEEVRLEVRASNEVAQRLYEHCGFEVAGRRVNYYAAPTEDAVLMRCRIDSGVEDRLV